MTRACTARRPVVAVSDWMRAVRTRSPWVEQNWTSLGTDGFGLSDTREAARRHSRRSAVVDVAALGGSWPAQCGEGEAGDVASCDGRYGLETLRRLVGLAPSGSDAALSLSRCTTPTGTP
ncbi:hypothetical protein GCM10020221_25090 [Streptomyces thioluteus]|uniref:Uncharacterized protein n=1 Tax=Streptomyces thioluteus TaxID=66431 RepID=A0ABN3WW40_STRTU